VPTTTTANLPLTLEQYSQERKLPIEYLVKTWGLKNVVHDGVSCVEQPYTRKDGVVCAPRYRYANAKKSPSQSGDRIVLYGQKQLISTNPESIILVEGESDTQTLRYAAFNVLGIPGTSMWDKCLSNDPDIKTFLEFGVIFVIQEPPSLAEMKKGLDSPSKMVAKIRKSLPVARVVAIRLWEFAPRDEKGEPIYKDCSGLWMYHDGNAGSFGRALLIAAKGAARKEGIAERCIQSVLASDVEMDLTRWLWYDHIPIGDVTVFAGMPAKGKSTAAIDVVARLTTGKDFPGSAKQVEACEVAILASEDNPRTTTVPRLRAAAAEVDKVHLIQGTGDGKREWEIALDSDLGRLRTFLHVNPEIKLIVMDPVTSYIGDVDPNKPKEVRPFLNKLKKFAEEMNISLLLIMHLSKNPDVSALHRVGGAATWIEVPRSVWFFDVKQQEEGSTAPPSYVMVNGKLNIVADERKKSLEYTFAGVDVEIKGIQQSMGTIRWGEESNITLEQQYQKAATGKRGFPPEERRKAGDWLEKYLADGPKECLLAGEDAGFNKWTLRDAKKERGIGQKRVNGHVLWCLPANNALGEVEEEVY
jgi:putative DNA primase/helicase